MLTSVRGEIEIGNRGKWTGALRWGVEIYQETSHLDSEAVNLCIDSASEGRSGR